MEYLVTMTTHVPHGTTAAAVGHMRAREAAHTRELAAHGYVLRLWRPPLAPGEWRTLGLFAAAGAADLERVLASMPLRAWRSDEVQELDVHPNDPDPAPSPDLPSASEQAATEFLVAFTPAVPPETGEAEIEEATAREAERARELARQGHLVRLWLLPPEPSGPTAVSLWRAGGEDEMESILESLPERKYLKTQVTALTRHPSDPAAPGSRSRWARERTGADHA
jgi:muconolactone delta-isomerase